MPKVDPEDLNKREFSQTLTDEQIITERNLPRRSFLARTGVALAGGAAALILGRTAGAQAQDPDKPKGGDPDKANDPDKAKPQDPDKAKPSDPDKADKAKAQDPDKADPDKAKPSDPDKAKPQDPDKPKPPQ